MEKIWPEKTCSIERLVTRADDVDKVLSGNKTAVRRGGRYADLGEEWMLKDARYRITGVYQQKLGDMTDADAIREGFTTLSGYHEYLSRVHSGGAFPLTMNMWTHEFERADS